MILTQAAHSSGDIEVFFRSLEVKILKFLVVTNIENKQTITNRDEEER